MPRDRRQRLSTDPFDYRASKDGAVRILRGGREVCVIGGTAAARLLTRLEAAVDADAVQHLLARASGHYRHGNER